MKLNKFLWNNYKETEHGKSAIKLFTKGKTKAILEKHLGNFHYDAEQAAQFIEDFSDFTIKPIIPDELNSVKAEKLFDKIVKGGITLKDEKDSFDLDPGVLLDIIPVISTWLYRKNPHLFKPYFFKTRFQLLTQIADAFDIELPEVPLKRYKDERLKYYWKLCEKFLKFQEENEMTPYEFCAFLYDFAPKYIEQHQTKETELPQPTQVWLVGGDQSRTDFEFLDNYKEGNTSFWQGNLDTKRGDIIIMYCLTPRSCIHSIWRATQDGIADPFFHFYSSIRISKGIKVAPIPLKQLKEDAYFSKHRLVRKNLQGVNGYSFNAEDYKRVQELIEANGGSLKGLPQLYSPSFTSNETCKVERDVELMLIEPFLKELGYRDNDWVRQLTVRMGHSERNFPDYAFLNNTEKNYETAHMLIEAKYWIKNNKELEDTFKQVFSYGLRLSSKILVIADKDAIWIYERQSDSFDRTKYLKKYWKELEQPDEFSSIKKLIGRK